MSDSLSDDPEVVLWRYAIRERKVIGLAEKALAACRNVRTPLSVIKATARDNAAANSALQEWRESELAPVERERRTYRERLEFLEKTAFDLAVDGIMHSEGIAEIPFGYLDARGKNFRFTPITPAFLKLDKGTLASCKGLREILRLVSRDYYHDSPETEGLYTAITRGEPLLHFHAFSRNRRPGSKVVVGPVELYLTTRPVIYRREFMGLSVLLYDPPLIGVSESDASRRVGAAFKSVENQLNPVNVSS